jgi:hypothetical protein
MRLPALKQHRKSNVGTRLDKRLHWVRDNEIIVAHTHGNQLPVAHYQVLQLASNATLDDSLYTAVRLFMTEKTRPGRFPRE